METIDLTTQPPRSPYQKMAGLYMMPRTIDKLRAKLPGGNIGVVNAALTTQMAVDHFQLDAIIFAGNAGAVDPALHPGDVVVPAYWIHQMESVWSNPDSTKSGSYVLPEFYRPKYGHF